MSYCSALTDLMGKLSNASDDLIPEALTEFSAQAGKWLRLSGVRVLLRSLPHTS
jgi:hypothetical protein